MTILMVCLPACKGCGPSRLCQNTDHSSVDVTCLETRLHPGEEIWIYPARGSVERGRYLRIERSDSSWCILALPIESLDAPRQAAIFDTIREDLGTTRRIAGERERSPAGPMAVIALGGTLLVIYSLALAGLGAAMD